LRGLVPRPPGRIRSLLSMRELFGRVSDRRPGRLSPASDLPPAATRLRRRGQRPGALALCRLPDVRGPLSAGARSLAVMDALRAEALRRGTVPPEARRLMLFNQIFVAQIKARGRLSEVELGAMYNCRSRSPFQNLLAIPSLLKRGKIRIFGKTVHGAARPASGAARRQVVRRARQVVRRARRTAPLARRTAQGARRRRRTSLRWEGLMNAYSYYPGCSLHATAREYDESIRAVAGVIGLGLQESRTGLLWGHSRSCDRPGGGPRPGGVESESRRPKRSAAILIGCAACFSRLRTGARNHRGARPTGAKATAGAPAHARASGGGSAYPRRSRAAGHCRRLYISRRC